MFDLSRVSPTWRRSSLSGAACALLLSSAAPASAVVLDLYDGTDPANPLPGDRGSLLGLSIVEVLGSPIPGPIAETSVTGGVRVDTNADVIAFPGVPLVGGTNVGPAEYSGYTNYDPISTPGTLSSVNPDFPDLIPSVGYSLFFNASLLSGGTDNSADRAALSVILTSNDGRGIELGFEDNAIFAQSETFARAESAAVATADATDYEQLACSAIATACWRTEKPRRC